MGSPAIEVVPTGLNLRAYQRSGLSPAPVLPLNRHAGRLSCSSRQPVEHRLGTIQAPGGLPPRFRTPSQKRTAVTPRQLPCAVPKWAGCDGSLSGRVRSVHGYPELCLVRMGGRRQVPTGMSDGSPGGSLRERAFRCDPGNRHQAVEIGPLSRAYVNWGWPPWLRGRQARQINFRKSQARAARVTRSAGSSPVHTNLAPAG